MALTRGSVRTGSSGGKRSSSGKLAAVLLRLKLYSIRAFDTLVVVISEEDEKVDFEEVTEAEENDAKVVAGGVMTG